MKKLQSYLVCCLGILATQTFGASVPPIVAATAIKPSLMPVTVSQSTPRKDTIRASLPSAAPASAPSSDNNSCEVHYRQSAEYKKLVADIQTAQQQYKALEQKIKGLLKGHACPSQEYKIEVGEALLDRLKSGNNALNAIAQKLMAGKTSGSGAMQSTAPR